MDILAVCPNPSVDVTVSADRIEAGRLNRIAPPVITRSGKAINALKAAAVLGACGVASGFMFSNDADGFARELETYRCGHDFVSVNGDVRRNIKLCEAEGKLTELNSSGPAVGGSDRSALTKKVGELSKGCRVTVISGSLPSGCESGYYGELSRACGSRYKIVDTEGDRLVAALSSGATLIKPNREEAEKIAGYEISDADSALRAARVFISLGAGAVLLSAGGDGAYITDGSTLFFAKAPKVTVRSACGAGDCAVGAAAAFLAGHDGGLDCDALYGILRSAVAAGSASVSSPGTNLFERSGYDRLFNEVKPVRAI